MKAKYLINLMLFFTIFNGLAQGSKIKEANRQYAGLSYADAIKTYEKEATDGYKSEDMFQKLGNAYYFNAELVKANKWYSQLFEMNKNQAAEYHYRYSQTLKATGDYKKADEMLLKFNEISSNDERAKLFEKNKNYKASIESNNKKYVLTDAGINSEFYDYGTNFSNNKLVFASTRATKDSEKKTQWTGQAATTLFGAELMNDDKLGVPQRFSKTLTTTLNEDSPTFTNDGKTVYFTRNNINNGKQRTDRTRTTLLKLYKATFVNGIWVDIRELPFNSDEFSNGHPALSPDEKTLYFSSDRPGTMGQSDLYKVAITGNDTYGTPENLGATINTPGRETFAFVSQDNKLYFATDGRPGLGGLDIFVIDLNQKTPTTPENMGVPMNSNKDDFGLYMDAKTNSGYLTSNREGGKGFDDIYRFAPAPKPICNQELDGTITDSKTNEILPNTQLILLDNDQKEIATTTSNTQGKYNFKVICGMNYTIKASKEGFTSKEIKVTIPEISGTTTVPVQLEKIIIIPTKATMKVGDDLAKLLNIKMIYFDLNKSDIRPDAALELGKILSVMKEYPTMKIDIRSHTDCRATAKYNESLSDRRAKSSVAWIITNGIETARIKGKGYGESRLINKCADNVKCTEEEHQANRRSEFIIVAM